MIHRSHYFKGATNNAMELQGVIDALLVLTNGGVIKLSSPAIVINTDSKYVYNAFRYGWITKWQKKRFHKVKNADRWKQLIALIMKVADVRFKWVKGHADNKGNNYVDKLLNAEMDKVEAIQKARHDEKTKEKVKI